MNDFVSDGSTSGKCYPIFLSPSSGFSKKLELAMLLGVSATDGCLHDFDLMSISVFI